MAGVSGLGEVRRAVFTAAWEAGRKDGNDYEETSGYDLGFEDGSRYAVSDDGGQRAAGVGARGQAGAVEEGAGGSESREGGRLRNRGAGDEGARTDLKKLGVASGTDAAQRVVRRESHEYGGEVITVSDRLEVYGADGKKTTVQAISTGKDVILREGDPMYGQHRLHELEHVRQRSMTDEEITAAFKEKTKDLPDGKVRSILRAYALDYYGLYGEDSTTMGDLYREYLADRAAGIPQKETDKAVRLPDERNAAKDQRRDIYAMRGNQTQEHLTRDKYYDRQIDKWDGKDHGGSFRVGSVSAPLLKVGIPDTDIWFDQSKAAKQLMEKKEITKDILKKIPDVLAHPIAVSESYDNTVMVFGQLFDEQNNPIVVALRINSTNRRNHITLVNKIRSVGTRTHNLDKLLSEDSLLYLGENKKETNTWFNALGRSTPFGGTMYGLIRSISQSGGKVNGTRKENYSLSAPERDKTYLSAVESGDMETAQKMVEEAAKAAGYVTHAYHGTLTKGITEFKKSFIGSRFSYDEVGFFFTDNLKLAQDYATSEFDADRKGEVISAYIRTKNAFTFDAAYALKNGYGKVFRDNDAVDVWDNYQSALLEEAEEHRADSIIIKDGNSMMVVAFEPNQIKSAEPVVYDNSGNVIPLSERFNPRKRDIRYSDRDNRAQKSIKDQIRANAAALSEMKSVANIRADLRGMNIKEKRQWAENVLKASGYRVDRQAFGVIAFEPRHINEGLNYLSDDGEIAAFAALPQLLKRGKIIDVHNNHKGRDFGTVTIAAPVEINGVRGNMAAVVKRTGKDHYHTHRILMPDGSAFEFLVQENTEPKPAGALSETDTHATPMDPVSENRIAQNGSTVKRQERDTVSAEIATLQRDLRQMRAELKRLKGSEGHGDRPGMDGAHGQQRREPRAALVRGGDPAGHGAAGLEAGRGGLLRRHEFALVRLRRDHPAPGHGQHGPLGRPRPGLALRRGRQEGQGGQVLRGHCGALKEKMAMEQRPLPFSLPFFI